VWTRLRIDNKKTKKVALLGIFLSYILLMGLIERMTIPLDGAAPGMKLGLANLAVIMSLYMFSVRDTLLLVAMKCVITSMLSGSVMALFYSMAGSLASLLIMQTLIRFKSVSPIGVSVAGAAFHNIAQTMVARIILSTWGIFMYLPFLLAVGTISGILVGVLTKTILPRLRDFERMQQVHREIT
jgi:heptaprenyl diphosphate synthase